MQIEPSAFAVPLAFFGFGLVGLDGGANGTLLSSLSAFYWILLPYLLALTVVLIGFWYVLMRRSPTTNM